MTNFVLRAAIAAFGLWLASELIAGLSFANDGWLVVAAVVLGIVNALVRPLAIVLTFPITLVTLGLFLIVINGAMLALVAWLLPGFHLASFGDAVLGALVVSVVSWIGSAVFVGRP